MTWLEISGSTGFAGQITPVIAHVIIAFVPGQIVGQRGGFQRAVVSGPELRPVVRPGRNDFLRRDLTVAVQIGPDFTERRWSPRRKADADRSS